MNTRFSEKESEKKNSFINFMGYHNVPEYNTTSVTGMYHTQLIILEKRT